MGKTHISWATDVWNPWVGCSKVSRGCQHCYAERMAHRLQADPKVQGYEGVVDDQGHWTGKVNLLLERFQDLLHWKKSRKVFVCSMSDPFHEAVPEGAIWNLLRVASRCPQHTFLFLTKRPERMVEVLQRYTAVNQAPSNAWMGVTIEGQKEAERRLPLLWRVKTRLGLTTFASAEPLLEKINLYTLDRYPFCDSSRCFKPIVEAIDWLIVGGESGTNYRPMNLDWARALRDQCHKAGVKFFYKQAGGRYPGQGEVLDGHLYREWPEELELKPKKLVVGDVR